MRMLARVLQAVERLVTDRDTVDSESGALVAVVPSAAELHLLQVIKGSAVYRVAADQRHQVVDALKRTGDSLESPSESEWSWGQLSAIEELSAIARSLNCEIQFLRDGGKATGPASVLARIQPQTYSHLAEGAFVRGHSTAIARVERVGGATEMRCGVRLASQPDRMVFCDVATPDLVRELGRSVYQRVVLTGQFTWVRSSWRVRHINVEGAHPLNLDTDRRREALQELRQLAGPAWRKIPDPSAFIAKLRMS